MAHTSSSDRLREDPDALLERLLTASSWSAARQLIEAHPDLLSAAVVTATSANPSIRPRNAAANKPLASDRRAASRVSRVSAAYPLLCCSLKYAIRGPPMTKDSPEASGGSLPRSIPAPRPPV